jgi:hypothetical protein
MTQGFRESPAGKVRMFDRQGGVTTGKGPVRGAHPPDGNNAAALYAQAFATLTKDDPKTPVLP